MLELQDIYEVKEIVGMKKVGEKYFYKVRWRGYGPDGDTWEPQNNLYTCHDVIEEYKTKMINKLNKKKLKSNDYLTCENNDSIENIDEKNKPKTNASKCVVHSKDNFWKELESGKIDVFKEDLYSRVKNRNLNKNRKLLNTNVLVDRDLRSKQNIEKKRRSQIYEKHFNNVEKLNIQIGVEKKTPLIYASEVGNFNLVKFLLKKGAYKNVQDNNGNTALIMAAKNGHNDVVKLLLSQGANFATINNQGSNALREAKHHGFKEIRATLTSYVSKITMALESQVIAILQNIAQLSHALFPIQCYSLNESYCFKFSFNYDQVGFPEPGIGYLLFIAESNLFDVNFIKSEIFSLKFCSPSVKVLAVLNGIDQRSLTEGAKFVFSFTPLRQGLNELTLSIKDSCLNKCFIICAYQVQLINSKNFRNLKSK